MLDQLSARLQLMLAALFELSVCNSVMESVEAKHSATLLLHANLHI